MTIKRWFVTAVDFDMDGQCDGKARILKVCKTRDDAVKYIQDDMKLYKSKNQNMMMDETKMRIVNYGWECGCEWNVEEIDVDVDECEVKK